MSASTVLTHPSIADRMARASSMLPIVNQTGMWMTPTASRTSGTIVRQKSATLAIDSASGIFQRFTSDRARSSCDCRSGDFTSILLGRRAYPSRATAALERKPVEPGLYHDEESRRLTRWNTSCS